MLTPDILATARSVVTHPEHYLRQPGVVRDRWLLLKEAQGQPVSRVRLARLQAIRATSPAICARIAAVTGADGTPHVAVQIAPHLARAAQKVRAIIARDTGPTGGDAG